VAAVQAADVERMGFQLALRRRGISDQAVLRAMDEVPREYFVAAEFTDSAYADQALPIACGQTISQPYVVGYMTERLEVAPAHRVLEIGTGSGYQAAVLACLAPEVFTVEFRAGLATEAADYLVHKGIPFRQAHDFVGKVLREAEKQNIPWTSLPLDTLKKISPAFDADFANSLSVASALAAKKVPGATAPESVGDAIANLERRLNKKTTKTGAQP